MRIKCKTCNTDKHIIYEKDLTYIGQTKSAETIYAEIQYPSCAQCGSSLTSRSHFLAWICSSVLLLNSRRNLVNQRMTEQELKYEILDHGYQKFSGIA